jgi:hypothetical protein
MRCRHVILDEPLLAHEMAKVAAANIVVLSAAVGGFDSTAGGFWSRKDAADRSRNQSPQDYHETVVYAVTNQCSSVYGLA